MSEAMRDAELRTGLRLTPRFAVQPIETFDGDRWTSAPEAILGDSSSWHLDRACEAMERKDWFAAKWHLSRQAVDYADPRVLIGLTRVAIEAKDFAQAEFRVKKLLDPAPAGHPGIACLRSRVPRERKSLAGSPLVSRSNRRAAERLRDPPRSRAHALARLGRFENLETEIDHVNRLKTPAADFARLTAALLEASAGTSSSLCWLAIVTRGWRRSTNGISSRVFA